MHSERTTREAVATLLKSVEDWLSIGVCQKCAIVATAAQFMVDYDTVETLWVDSQVSKL